MFREWEVIYFVRSWIMSLYTFSLTHSWLSHATRFFSGKLVAWININFSELRRDGYVHHRVHKISPLIFCVARHHPHRTHDLRSGSQDHHPSKNSVQKTICCNSTSNAPDDGHMRPKYVELRIYQSNHLILSSWHFIFHEEVVRSNNPVVSVYMFVIYL